MMVLQGHFLIRLVKEHVMLTQKRVAMGRGVLGPRMVILVYEQIPTAGVEWIYGGEEMGYGSRWSIRATVATPMFETVTGIVKEDESHARADAISSYRETETRRQLRSLSEAVLKEQSVDPKVCHAPFCSLLEPIPPPSAHTFHFTLYDDGWRVD